jgi:hypothetical protein
MLSNAPDRGCDLRRLSLPLNTRVCLNGPSLRPSEIDSHETRFRNHKHYASETGEQER